MVKNKLDFNKRPLSYSSISSFEYNKEKWYETYILGKRQSSRQLTFGSSIDLRLQNDPTFLPMIPRCPMLQHEMVVSFNGIKLVGKPDAIDLEKYILRDYKTGVVKWDKKRADETDQFTMYLFLVYIKYKIRPENFKCFIDWMPTCENDSFEIGFMEPIEDHILQLETSRSMKDIINFGAKIKRIVKEMEEYVKKHK
ncbi:MAG: hypothetical protein V4469_04505 [Patescibacteria group bacterium]